MSEIDNLLDNQQKMSRQSEGIGLRRISNIYIWLGSISIVLGLFLLIGSIIAAINNEKITSEPFFGAYFLSGGMFSLLAGYIGDAIDDIRNNTKKN